MRVKTREINNENEVNRTSWPFGICHLVLILALGDRLRALLR